MPKGSAKGRMWGFQLWANLPRWATAFCQSATPVKDGWLVEQDLSTLKRVLERA